MRKPTIEEIDATTESGANPETLCANWQKWCNGVTDGVDEKGNLTLCDDCHTAEQE